MELADYLPIVVMFVLAAAFAGVSLIVSWLLSYKRPTAEKLAPYECGIVTEEEPLNRFPVKFYLVAILFVIFDVETIFLFPWAIIYDELALFGLIEMFIFLGILIVGYFYVWKKGALEWA